jgi:hypothetical protein
MRHQSVPPSLQSRMTATIAVRCLTFLVLGFGGSTGALFAQDNDPAPPVAPAPPLPPAPSGLQIKSVSAYAVYYSNFLPTGGAAAGSAHLPSDVGAGGSIVFDWTKFTERSTFSLSYTPSYTGYVRNSSLNALDHALSLTASRKIAPQWTFEFSAAGALSTLQESQFGPTALDNVAAASATFNQLAAALLSGNFVNNPQLGAILNTAPLGQSPISNLLYGQRMFTASAHASLSYSYSPRLSVTFSGGGARSQHIEDQALGAGNAAILPNTNSGNASLGISYSLSPLTQIGGSVTTSRTSSVLYDGYTTTSLATMGRTFGGRWVAQIHGGVGVTNPVRETNALVAAKAGPVIGGSLTYKTLSHTFLGSYERGVSDTYGIGASTNSAANAAWQWRHPGSTWWLGSNFGWQQLQGNILANTSGWNTTVSLNRAIGPHFVVLTQYVHLTYSGALQAIHISQDSGRVSIMWMPHPVAIQ